MSNEDCRSFKQLCIDLKDKCKEKEGLREWIEDLWEWMKENRLTIIGVSVLALLVVFIIIYIMLFINTKTTTRCTVVRTGYSSII